MHNNKSEAFAALVSLDQEVRIISPILCPSVFHQGNFAKPFELNCIALWTF